MLEVVEIAGIVAHQYIRVAIIIKVANGRSYRVTQALQSEGIRAWFPEKRVSGISDIFHVDQITAATIVTDQEVQIAVYIEISG